LGRVIKETGNVIELEGDSTVYPLPTVTYNYDERGNQRAFSTPDHYDDKVSFLSTRKVLMFTERNYSKINMVAATGYNEYGLPTGFSPDQHNNNEIFLLGLPSEISYHCE
jgi:hypothetical protein